MTELHVNSGQYVEKGEPILSISTGNEGIQASVVDAQIAELEETLTLMDRYEEAIATKTNTLNREGQELGAALRNLLRSNAGKTLTRQLRSKITQLGGFSTASIFTTAINILGTFVGLSASGMIAHGLDIADGKKWDCIWVIKWIKIKLFQS